MRKADIEESLPQPPPFCPNAACPNHHALAPPGWYRPFGTYSTQAYGRVKRYICLECGRSFSAQTFSVSCYLHLSLDLRDLFFGAASCSGIRAMAGKYGATDKVIGNRLISEWLVWLRACHTPFRSGFLTLPAYTTGGERHRAPLPRAA